jgi:DNA (cytosine-5)-methyltransferase 1
MQIKPFRYGSVCSGIEAATQGWHRLGWKPSFFSEIDPFPRAVLKHHYPDVPLHGDFTTIQENDYDPINLLVGGTPCQSFSVAGLRGGMDDDRGNLALEFLRLAKRLNPTWICWENVPGVLSANGGRDFGSFLGGLVELRYGFCWRVLDAQYCRTQQFPSATPQRRKRLFLVGYLGDWRPAAASLFEQESMLGHPPPCRKKGTGLAPYSPGRIGESRSGPATLTIDRAAFNQGENAHFKPVIDDSETMATLVAKGPHAVGQPFSIMPMNGGKDYKGRETDVAQPVLTQPSQGDQGGDFIVEPMCFDETQITHPENRSNPKPGDPCGTLAADARPPTIAYPIHDQATRHAGKRGDKQDGKGNGLGIGGDEDPSFTLTVGDQHAVAFQSNGNADDILAAGDEVCPTIRVGSGNTASPPAVAFKPGQSAESRSIGAQEEVACTLEANGGGNNQQAVMTASAPAIGMLKVDDCAGAMTANHGRGHCETQVSAFVFKESHYTRGKDGAPSDVVPPLTAEADKGDQDNLVNTEMTVRRLSVEECEKLQCFPPGFTKVPYRGKPASECKDSPRYKAIGNSMACNVMELIGSRIEIVRDLVALHQPAPLEWVNPERKEVVKEEVWEQDGLF